jgi:hypothetical protein
LKQPRKPKRAQNEVKARELVALGQSKAMQDDAIAEGADASPFLDALALSEAFAQT